MKVISQNIKESIEKDLQQKFVFLSGSRQVGKTTLARKIIGKKNGTYLLYDDDDDRQKIFKKEYVNCRLIYSFLLNKRNIYPKFNLKIRCFHYRLQSSFIFY
jgi:predicted AAA+ superfamily ATPase